jgi:hypothetical protein
VFTPPVGAVVFVSIVTLNDNKLSMNKLKQLVDDYGCLQSNQLPTSWFFFYLDGTPKY